MDTNGDENRAVDKPEGGKETPQAPVYRGKASVSGSQAGSPGSGVESAPGSGIGAAQASASASGKAKVPGKPETTSGEGKPPVKGSASVRPGDAAKQPPVKGSASVRPAARPEAGRAGAAVRDAAPAHHKPGASVATARDKRKRVRRRRILGTAMSILVLLLGLGFIGGSYFYDGVPRPEELTLANNTEVYAADGKTPLARLGAQNRTEISMASLPEKVRNALIAGEDKNFYEHHGIDMRGIARAAWNNFTGGALQGASTITQQYARHAASDLEISYSRKLREAIMARKIEDTYTKVEILGFYLNTVYFGRGAYGVGAAAEAYFGISPGSINTLTVEQAAVLGAVLKQPEPEGSAKGYDPHNDPEAARDRWNYVLNNMMEMGWIPVAERTALTYPEVRRYDAAKGAGFGWADSPTGHVINYIAKELDQRGVVAYLNENRLGNWKNAGLRITTTIDPRVQKAMEAELNRAVEGSTMSKQRPNIIGAGVAIEPSTGRVLAYYGGVNDGTKDDWAGTDHPHPPASSFKIYTLAAAVEAGLSVKSTWSSRELKKSNGDAYDLSNASRDADQTCDLYCTLEEMTIKSFNVPFFKVAEKIGTDKVIGLAHKAGIRTMWTENLQPHDLSKGIPGRNVFDYFAGIGQYPVTVIDHATGTATFANHGIRNQAHFVIKVERKNRKNGAWEHLEIGDEKAEGVVAIPANVVDEVTSVLKQIPGSDGVAGTGRESAGKTGTWENPLQRSSAAHVWFTGYTSQIAATMWAGSNDINATPIKTVQGGNMGSLFPKGMWKRFMDSAHEQLKLPPTKLASGTGVGTIEGGTGVSPTPSPPPSPTPDPSAPPSIPPTARPTVTRTP